MSNIGCVRSAIVYNSVIFVWFGFLVFVVMMIGIVIASIMIIECVADLCICSSASRSGSNDMVAAIIALFIPMNGAVIANATEKCVNGSGILVISIS